VSIESVEQGIYRIPSVLGRRRFAQWLVVGDHGLLLVDSGVDGTIAEQVLPALAEIGRGAEEIREVVITHADVDHYGGDAELRRLVPGARIRASAADRPWIESWEMIARERYGWYRRHGLDYDEATWAWLQGAAGPDTPLDGEVTDGDRIDLGGIIVEVLALPGHSPGHLGVVHRDTGIAIVMDAVLERGLYTTDGELISPPPYGSVSEYRATIARLRELAPIRLGTSHYAPVEGREAVDAFLAASGGFVDDLDACIQAELTLEPRPLEAFWRAAEAALGPFDEMAVELARSVAAHLDAAVAAGSARVAEAGGRPAWAAV
jgi:glyoxylase-like metal-dependent hydrolase (beta-lactamase superfamily II)